MGSEFNITKISDMVNNSDYLKAVQTEAKKLLGNRDSLTIDETISIFKGKNPNLDEKSIENIKQIASSDGDEHVNLKELSTIYTLFDAELGSDNKFHFDGQIQPHANSGIKEVNAKELTIIKQAMGIFDLKTIDNMSQSTQYKNTVLREAAELMGDKESLTVEEAVHLLKGKNFSLDETSLTNIKKIAAANGDEKINLEEFSAMYALFDAELGTDDKLHFDGSIGNASSNSGIKEATDKELNSILKTFGAITSESSSSTESVSMAVVKSTPTKDIKPPKENTPAPISNAAKKTDKPDASNTDKSKPQNNTAAKKTENNKPNTAPNTNKSKTDSSKNNTTASSKKTESTNKTPAKSQTDKNTTQKPQNNTAEKKTENNKSNTASNTSKSKTDSSKNNTTVSSKKTESTNKTPAKSQTVKNTTQKSQKIVNPAKSATNGKS